MTPEAGRMALRHLRRSVLGMGALALVACVPIPYTDAVAPETRASVGGGDAPPVYPDGDREGGSIYGPEAEDASSANTDEGVGAPRTGEADGTVDPSEDVDPVASSPTAETGPGRISDEQDFDAVSNRQTIESDAARLKAQRDAYLEIRYGELPERDGDGAPNIVEFALSTSNAVGEKVWPRIGIFSVKRHERNCAGYANEDFAQEAFLANGGPRRNWSGLDPDGDGFACGWDPKPFRDVAAVNG